MDMLPCKQVEFVVLISYLFIPLQAVGLGNEAI